MKEYFEQLSKPLEDKISSKNKSFVSNCCNFLINQQSNDLTMNTPIHLIKHKILNPFIDFDGRNPPRYFY